MKSERFGEKVRALMDRLGISEQRMADFISEQRRKNDPSIKGKTHQQTVNDWIKDSRVPAITYLFPMARMLGVTVDYLIDDAMDEPEPKKGEALPKDEDVILTIYRANKERLPLDEMIRRMQVNITMQPVNAGQAPIAEGGGGGGAEPPAKATDTGTIVNKRTVKGETVPEKGKGNPGGSDLDPKPEGVPGDGGAGVRPVPRRRR